MQWRNHGKNLDEAEPMGGRNLPHFVEIGFTMRTNLPKTLDQLIFSKVY